MEEAAGREEDLRKTVSQNLNQGGYPATPQSLDPDDQSSLAEIKDRFGEAVHIAGDTTREVLTGVGPKTHTRVTSAKTFLQKARERLRQLTQRRAA